ncbi:hypothetical protein ACWCPT_02085 [Streptomyces sp. NPDC002308]
MPHDDGESPARRFDAPTYAVLAAEARRQAALPRPKARSRGESDVRSVPWWRVETLRSMSGLSILVSGVVRVVLGLYIVVSIGFASVDLDNWYGIVGWFALALYAAYCLFGRPGTKARELARAACAPGPVHMRYALVYDPPWGGAALLALFPAGEDGEARPVGVVQLAPLLRGRFAKSGGLPADPPVAPVGTLELRGRTDDSPCGVPWIEDRVYWPKRSWGPEFLEGPEGPALLARLLDADAEHGEAVES